MGSRAAGAATAARQWREAAQRGKAVGVPVDRPHGVVEVAGQHDAEVHALGPDDRVVVHALLRLVLGDAHVQDGVLAGGEEVVAHEIALVHALEEQLPPAEGHLRTGRAGRAGVAALLEARQVAPTERPAAVVVFAARLVLAARLVREEVVGSFDVANHVLDGKAHLEQAARVAPRRPAPRATAGGAAAAALRRSRFNRRRRRWL